MSLTVLPSHRSAAAPDTPAAQAPRPRRRGRWRIVLPGMVLFAVLVGVHLVLSGPMRVPIIHPDELGYLENARFLARGGLRSETEYYPGYSLLLIPFWLLGTVPATIYRQTLQLQAVLGGLGGVLVWVLTPRLVPQLVGWRRLLVVVAVCAYPASLLFGDFALAEAAFSAMFALVVLAAAAALQGRSPARWLVLGLTSGLLVLVHPRGLAVAVAAGLAGFVVLGVRRSSVLPLLGLAGGLAASLGATRWLVTYVKGPAANGFAAYRPDGVLSKSLSVHGAASLVAELAGQLFYLSVSTFGLVPLGLVLGTASLVRVIRGGRERWTLTQAFVTLAFYGVWALSSLFMNLGDRTDKLIYGRYNEGVIAPLLVIGLAEIVVRTGTRSASNRLRHRARSGARTVGQWAAAGATVTAAGALFVRFGHSAAALHQALNPVNVLGLAPVLSRMGGRLDPVVIAAAAVAALCTLALVAWRLPVLAVVLVVAVFVASALDTEERYVIPGTRARAAQNDIALALAALRTTPDVDTSCIGYDADEGVDYNYYNDRFLLPGQRFVWFNATRLESPCGTLVVSRRPDFGTRYAEARLITSEDYQPQSLWAVPRESDPTFDTLGRDGWLSPPSPSNTGAVALPKEALTGARFTLTDPPPPHMAPGSSTPLKVVLEHLPGGAPWPAAGALHTGTSQYAVQLAVRWYPATDPLGHPGDAVACPSGFGDPVAHSCPPPLDLPATLLPGQRATVPLTLRAVDSSGQPLAAGAYMVEFGLLQQGVASFSGPPLHIQVVVG